MADSGGEEDILERCRRFYGKRVQHLERFKGSIGSTTLHNDSESVAAAELLATADSTDNSSPCAFDKFLQLKKDMVCLMEKDVTLMRQMLALGETVEELRSMCCMSRASSVNSLQDTDNETTYNALSTHQFQVTGSSPAAPRKQYFSRQNSVLRIPIPPCHRNRIKTIASLGSFEDGDDTSSSGVSSQSGGSIRSTSATRTDQANDRQHGDESTDQLSPLSVVTNSCRSSNRHSTDSGIDLEGNEQRKRGLFT